jgi:hypothetical protein
MSNKVSWRLLFLCLSLFAGVIIVYYYSSRRGLLPYDIDEEKYAEEVRMYGNVLYVEAEVVDYLAAIELPFGCGNHRYFMEFKFLVHGVVKGDYLHDTIRISFGCPREHVELKHLVNNKTYRYKILTSSDYRLLFENGRYERTAREHYRAYGDW